MILVNSFDKFYSVVSTKMGVVCCSYLEESLATRVLASKGELIMIWEKGDFKKLLSLPVQRLTSFEEGFVFTDHSGGAIYYFNGKETSKLIPNYANLNSISPRYSDDYFTFSLNYEDGSMDSCKYVDGKIEMYKYKKRGYESHYYFIGIEKKSIIECFDKAINKIIWTRRIDEFGIINSYDIKGNILSTRPNEINSEIWSDDDFVYIPFEGAELACLSIKTGETMWFKDDVKIYAIVIYDQYIYANGHGKLYHIEKSNGVIVNEICTTNHYPNFQAQLPLYINDEVILLAMVSPGRVMIIDRKKFEYVDDVDLPDENVGIPNSRGSLEWRDNHLFVLTVGNKVHVYKSEEYSLI